MQESSLQQSCVPWLTPDSLPGAASFVPCLPRWDSSRSSPAQPLQTAGAAGLLQLALSLGISFFLPSQLGVFHLFGFAEPRACLH